MSSLRIPSLTLLLLLLLPACSESGGGKSKKADRLAEIGYGGERPVEEMSAPELLLMARTTAEAGDSKKAIELFRRVVELEPEIADVHFMLGQLLVPTSSSVVLGTTTTDYDILDEAIEHFELAIALEPEKATYLYWAGRALDLRGREEDAIERLTKALELSPEHGKAAKRLGLIHAELGNADEAARWFERAIELSPGDPGSLAQLGRLKIDSDPEAARALFERALELNRTFAAAHEGLAILNERLGDVSAAGEARELAELYQGQRANLQRMEALADAEPGNVEAQFDAAEANFLLKRYERAAQLLERVVMLQPDHVYAHYYFGLIRMENEEWEWAMNHFEECLFYDKSLIGARVELIRVCTILGNEARVAELAAELETMVETSEDPQVLNAVAEVFLEIGRADRAVSYLNSVLEADPGNETARILLDRARG